jgi:hypothetical protein
VFRHRVVVVETHASGAITGIASSNRITFAIGSC